MRILDWNAARTSDRNALLETLRRASDTSLVRTQTQGILEEVKMGCADTLLSLTQKYDGVTPKSLLADLHQVNGDGELNPEQKDAIALAYENIYTYHQAQMGSLEFQIETMPGVHCQRITRAIPSVGLYVPGGNAPLVSSLLMMAIPAQVAGCEQIILCTPPDKSGELNAAIRYAAKLCSIEKIFLVGGAQAIGAMAYGISPLPRVDKIYGPGNRFVTMAKQLVSMEENGPLIDLPAGPSEVLVIADSSANPGSIAADLISQAEHDADARVICILTEPDLLEPIQVEVEIQLSSLPRKEIAARALEESFLILSNNLDSALDLSNEIAPEHLILNIKNPRKALSKIQNAGSIFLGPWTPESFGDYASGTNHVLPTNGAARSYSGLCVESFLKTISVQECTTDGFLSLAPTVETLAALENLDAHRLAVSKRREILAQERECLELPQNLNPVPGWIRRIVPAHILGLKPYESARFLSSGQSKTIFLDANENPYEALVGDGNPSLNRYPEPQDPVLLNRLSEFYDISSSQILLCRGSDEGIDLLMRGFCRPGRDAIASFAPTFGFYENCANLNNLEHLSVSLSQETDFLPDWEALKDICIKNPVKLVFLCSPNNPTGQILRRSEIQDFLKFSAKRFLVILDEAYAEFSADGSLKDLLPQFPNLVILRTFSKGMGLAGLRFGTALGNQEVLNILKKITPPYPIPSNVTAAMLAFLQPGPLLLARRRIEELIAERERVRQILQKCPEIKKVFPGEGNFLLVKCEDTTAFMTRCKEFGILPRDRSAEIPGCIRISIGTPQENNALLNLFLEKADGMETSLPPNRVGEVSRVTKETSIHVRTELSPQASTSIHTQLPFLDHMLEQVCRHGQFGLDLHCTGDLQVDDHHSIEDCALALGESIKIALGERRGISRYGFSVPMDESLAHVSLDLSGRASFVLKGNFGSGRLGNVNLEMIPHFFQSFSQSLGCALHIEVEGENTHHKVEAAFKGLGKSLAQAIEIRSDQIPSTKGVL